ncbi:MAG: hemolysin family protein [Pirellulales bacterium]
MAVIDLVVIAAMIAINSVFAAYEIALASVSVARLQLLVRENRAGAKAALQMKQRMERSLAAVQVGITLVGAIAAATGGAGAEVQIAPFFERMGLASGPADFLAILVVVIPLTMVTIMFGELVPKVFALRNKEWVCLRMSAAMRGFALAVWPGVWIFEKVVMGIMRFGEHRWQHRIDGDSKPETAPLRELFAFAAMARTARLIGEREENIILGAARLSSRRVREIMLPSAYISMLNVNDSVADCLVAAHLDMHTRFPVTEKPGDPQAIIGYVNFKDIVAQLHLVPDSPSLRGILRPIPSERVEAIISSCMERLIREHAHIALIRDVANSVVGLVTLEDILEELVGEIEDEYDRLPVYAVASGAAWVVGGGVLLPRLKELTGIDLASDPPSTPARTLNEWVAGHLGRRIRRGDAVERGDRRVLVRKVRRRQVLEAQVSEARTN